MTSFISDSLFYDLGQKLNDPISLKNLVCNSFNNSDLLFPDSPWNDISLCCGYPSLLLLSSVLRNKGLVDEKITHSYVLKIKEILETDGIFDLSLFSGLSGVCFAIQQASCGGPGYSRMLDSLHTLLFKKIDAVYLDPLRANRKNRDATFSSLYDPIQGISGVGRYLLEYPSLPNFSYFLEEIIKALVNLSLPMSYHGYSIPGWYLSPKDPLNYREKDSLHGNFNLGLAHGIPGVLAFLSMAYLKGVYIEGLKDALQRISQWIREKSFLVHGMIRWSTSVSWEEEVGIKPLSNDPCRDAWCYGVPGVARSLFLAGKALQDDDLKNFAATAFRGVFLRSKESWGLPGPALCHGVAGLLLITDQMAKEKGCEDLLPRVKETQEILCSFYQKDSFLGFKDPQPTSKGEYFEIDNPGFLEGTTGIVCTLLSLTDPTLQWHLPMLI